MQNFQGYLRINCKISGFPGLEVSQPIQAITAAEKKLKQLIMSKRKYLEFFFNLFSIKYYNQLEKPWPRSYFFLTAEKHSRNCNKFVRCINLI